MAPQDIVRSYPLIDELLEARRNLWPDQAVFAGYRNHTYRMLNFARQWIAPSPERDEKLATCAVFHDLAVWPDGNLDYLKPSADLAEAYLDQIGRSTWKSEMRLMIEWHHKISSYRGENRDWVESIRRADWCDISFTMFRYGLPRSFVNEVRQAFPLGAFYPGHVYKVIGKWIIRHPLNPVPIMRW